MFGFGGTPAKTRGQLSKEELGIGFDHLMQAAAHAAGGAGAAVGPRYHAVRTVVAPTAGRVKDVANNGWINTRSTFAPLVEAAREGAREATEAALKARAKEEKRLKREQRMSRKKIGLIVGVLVAGAAAGAATALVIRRRRGSQWEEFDPTSALESVKSGTGDLADKISDRAKDMKESAADTAKDIKSGAKDMAKDFKSGARDMGQETKGMAKDAAEESKSMANDLTDSNSYSSNRLRR